MDELVSVKNLKKEFPLGGGLFSPKVSVKAVRGVSFSILKGETLGLVGESGCGKSTLGRCLLRLHEMTSGEVGFAGSSLNKMKRQALKSFRRRAQIIFQDPYSSLNPRLTIGSILEEALVIHKLFSTSAERRKRVAELLDKVGLPRDCVERYPHEFSGGQRQRIGIARALAVEPEFIVCDEPVSALDVSVQAQVLNLLMDLQDELGLTYLFISHDLNVVRHISHRVAVMYLGRVVEIGDKQTIFESPKHPYTQALLSAVPDLRQKTQKKRIVLQGDLPKPTEQIKGCAFQTRCYQKQSRCEQEKPKMTQLEKQSYTCFYPASSSE